MREEQLLNYAMRDLSYKDKLADARNNIFIEMIFLLSKILGFNKRTCHAKMFAELSLSNTKGANSVIDAMCCCQIWIADSFSRC